jgi:hypothetical protein
MNFKKKGISTLMWLERVELSSKIHIAFLPQSKPSSISKQSMMIVQLQLSTSFTGHVEISSNHGLIKYLQGLVLL